MNRPRRSQNPVPEPRGLGRVEYVQSSRSRVRTSERAPTVTERRHQNLRLRRVDKRGRVRVRPR